MSMFRRRAAAINAWRMGRAKAQELFGTISQVIYVNKCPQRRDVLIDGLGRMLDD
jgi:hypothetical protein